jgi:hypothetical protein
MRHHDPRYRPKNGKDGEKHFSCRAREDRKSADLRRIHRPAASDDALREERARKTSPAAVIFSPH